MTRRITIKDIASKAGVSIGAVHCALVGKPGVSKATRQRIAAIAKECGYRPNAIASSLKRRAIRIAAAFPGPTNENRFYFAPVWEGIRDYLASMRDYNIEIIEHPYYNDFEGQPDELEKISREDGIDGVLTLGYMQAANRAMLERFRQQNIPLVLVGSDIPDSGRLCCVQPDYDVVGRTLAELLSWQAPGGDILLCAGNVMTPSHYEIVLGFEAHMAEFHPDVVIHKVHDAGGLGRLCRSLEEALSDHPGIAACCCVNAKSSVMLGRALESSGRAGSLPAVGCDVFEENIQYLERGTFTNLLHKNPYSQAFMAAKCLAEHLLGSASPARDIIPVGSEILFRSSLPILRRGQRTLNAVIA